MNDVEQPAPDEFDRLVSIQLEAVHSKRVRVMAWRELTDVTQWNRGWGWRRDRIKKIEAWPRHVGGSTTLGRDY